MGGTDIGIAAVGGTEEKRLLPLVVVGGAVPQLTAAVGAVEKPGEHTHDACPCGPAAVLAEGLNKGESLPVNDSGVGIGEDFPFLLRLFKTFLQLEGLPVRTEIHRVSGVLLPVQNVRNSSGTPVMRVCRGLGGALYANAIQILAWGHHAVSL